MRKMKNMTGQISLFDWISCVDLMPMRSGLYIVRDRIGREFETWYETSTLGFNHVYNGVGYQIMELRYV